MAVIKRAITIFTAIISLAASFFGISTDCFTKKAESFRVTSYIVADYVQDISSLYSEDFDIITDAIIFGSATFDAEGNVNLEKEELETALSNLRTVIGDRDVNISLNLLGPTYTGDSPDWQEQMNGQTEEHNKAFKSGVLEDNIIAVLEEYDFDGVHFDYEYPTNLKAHIPYNRFLVSLDKKLGDKYTLGVATNEWNLYFTAAAIEAVDTFELMMYDVYDDEGRHSTTETVKELVEKIEVWGVPVEKVNLGLPFYARPSDHDAYWYGYNGYYDSLDENNWYYDSELDKYFWFNTPDVIAEKTLFAINEGYGGVMIWHYSCDLPSTDEMSLLRAIGSVTE